MTLLDSTRLPDPVNLPDPSAGPIVMSIEDWCRETGQCKSTFYNLVAAGDFPARKIGRRTIILREDFAAWLKALPLIEPRKAGP